MPCPPEGRSTGITTTHPRRRTFSRTAGIRALGVYLCCWVAIGLTWSGEALARPQLIIVNTASDRTGDAASPANVARNMSFIESTGIDGVALNTDAAGNLMQKGKLSYDQVRRELAPLQGKMRQVRTNFVLTYVMNVDPFDSWAGVIDNWVTLARASRDVGMTGFIFDNEPYNGGVWIYPRDVKHAAAYSLAEYQKQYRRRGKELMTALTQVWPKLRFLVMHGPYLSDRRTPDHVVLDQGAVTDRDLSGFFFAGLLRGRHRPRQGDRWRRGLPVPVAVRFRELPSLPQAHHAGPRGRPADPGEPAPAMVEQERHRVRRVRRAVDSRVPDEPRHF